MKVLKYFFEYILIKFLFLIFKILDYEKASNLGEKIGRLFGPIFRSKNKITNNLIQTNVGKSEEERNKIINSMWGNYGRILAEYNFLERFKKGSLNSYIKIKGLEHLEKIKENKKQVVFVSGHFNNFELMAMQIDSFGIDVAAIYRPLNNFFLNKTMEDIRKNNICRNQIKKGKSGTRQLIEMFRNGYSIALMIDQRVSEGIKTKLFDKDCLTTTIPAQLVKKYNCDVVPVYIERNSNINFTLHFYEPLNFEKGLSTFDITSKLNLILEKMILKNPDQWIWSHDRWK